MKISVKNSRTPLNIQIYNEIKSGIEAGMFKEGDFLPTENELTAQFDVSRKTIRAALKRLEEESLAAPVHGQGWKVCPKPTEKKAFAVGMITSAGGMAQRHEICFRAFSQVLTSHGMSTRLYGIVGNSSDPGYSLNDSLDPTRIQGLFMLSGVPVPENIVNEVRQNRLPLVCAALDRQDSFDTVSTDNREACRKTLDYLISKGHKKILFLGTSEVDEISFRIRHNEYGRYMRDIGEEEMEINLEVNYISPEDFDLIIKMIKENDISAVLAVNEQLAWNMILHSSRTGISIPEEFSITAMGDEDRVEILSLGFEHFVYALHPWEEIGRITGEKMIQRLEGDTSPAELIHVSPVYHEVDTVLDINRKGDVI